MLPEMIDTGAVFSPCEIYRYRLWRTWCTEKPVMMCVGLNPSTADAKLNDPTIRRVISFADRWGYGKLYMANVFALRSTNPEALYGTGDPTGPDNDTHIAAMAEEASLILVAWGRHATYKLRDRYVMTILGMRNIVALNLNKDETPTHPLYQKLDAQPFPYLGRGKHPELR